MDDDVGDCRLVQESLKIGKLVKHVHVCNDGDDALAFLRQEGKHAKAPKADLVLLDLNMPRKDGFSTLKDIRSDAKLTNTPVVILTTSTAERDVDESYRLHANAFVSKPGDLDDFMGVMKRIEEFWADTARLPRA